MVVYIKFTNGAVTKLINMNDEVSQNEAIENGFYMLTDENGTPEVVESAELVAGKNLDRAVMLNAIAEKLANKSNKNKNSKTLTSKYKA